MEIRNILVPVDFSETSGKALRFALGLAEKWKATVHLLNVVPVPAYPPVVMVGSFDTTRFEAGLREEAERQLKELAGPHGQRIAGTRVVAGEPFWEICRAAEERRSDLIVMGSHGRTGMAHVLLGSVAERVVRHASCPVLVVNRKTPV